MERQDSGVDLKKYLLILKRATLFTQLLPFVYSSIYIIVLLVYPFISDEIAFMLDSAFYISPVFMVGTLVLSRILHLCVWHRIACCVPLVSQIPVLIDNYIVSMTQIEGVVSNSAIIVMTALLLVSAYKVFFSDGRK